MGVCTEHLAPHTGLSTIDPDSAKRARVASFHPKKRTTLTPQLQIEKSVRPPSSSLDYTDITLPPPFAQEAAKLWWMHRNRENLQNCGRYQEKTC